MEQPSHMQNNEENYANILDNVNVSEENDVVAFVKVVSTLAIIIIAIFATITFTSSTIIANLPLDKQIGLEKFLSGSVQKQFASLQVTDDKSNMQKIKELESNLMAQSPILREKGHFTYHIIKADEINAFVTADGNIYFTDKLLKEFQNDEQLTFILAHEMAHYIHKDHLKTFSRGIAGMIVCTSLSVFTNSTGLANAVSDAIDFTHIQHSQKDEINADKFANELTLKIYHSNKEVIKFFRYIGKKQGNAALLYFFATHPSPEARIKLLENGFKS